MIDISFFGTGAGLVVLSYTIGATIGMVMRALSVSREV